MSQMFEIAKNKNTQLIKTKNENMTPLYVHRMQKTNNKTPHPTNLRTPKAETLNDVITNP